MSRYTDKEMVKAAHYYYKQDLTQSQIAKRMGMSRQRVNRILKKAVEENIVQITIVDVDKYNVELESKLEERFNLKEAVVVSVQEEGEVIPSLGQAGAEYLERILQKDDIMGVTWGRTLSEVAKRLPLNENLKVSVVQLIGGMNIAFTDLKADEITREMARKLGGESHILYAPAIVESKEIKDAITSDHQLKETFNKMDKCRVMVVGIGELKEDTTLHKESYFDEEYKKHLQARKAVGDIGFRWYDKEGQPVEHDYDERTIGYDILRQKSKALKIGVAGGKRKYEAILGALRGQYIDVLITDSKMAERLVAE